jgi:hypothetical protein
MSTQLKLRKAQPERLRSLGLDEAWLQDQIARDPSLLGFGELDIIKKEKKQRAGGRIDFVMADPDPDEEVRYEIEIMLGETDPSHIIRTIEYWDEERQRYPTLEHHAVIVAEEITARFFNVIRLLNRAVPITAIQLSAFRMNDEVVLQFTHVLDDAKEFAGEPEDEDTAEPAETVNREYWEKKFGHESVAVVDAIEALVPTTNGVAKVTYTKNYIAIATNGRNFGWLRPRKAGYCHVKIKVGADNRPGIVKRLEDAGIDTGKQSRNSVRLHLRTKDIQEHRDLIAQVLRDAENWSR